MRNLEKKILENLLALRAYTRKKVCAQFMRNLETKILENLLALRAYTRKKVCAQYANARPNNLINIERSLMCSGFRFICCVVNSVTVGCQFG